MIRVQLLKRRRREVKVDPKFGGQWDVPSLVVNGRFHAWWPMEGERKTHFYFFSLSPQQTYLNF
jgi:hypothetical protein